EAGRVAEEGCAPNPNGGAAHQAIRSCVGRQGALSMPESSMRELVLYLARHLVNHPDAVEVRETQGETASVLELKVAKDDLGRVIGKQGRTAKSIRTILNAAASKAKRKGVLE